jgi:hypothetical protein
MLFHRHTPVIAYQINVASLDPPRWKLPATRVPHIKLLQSPSVDKKPPVAELDLVSLEGNNPFQKHHLPSSKSNYHNIAPVGLTENIPQSPTGIEFPIVIGRLHADASDSDGNADLGEEEIGY